LQARKLGRQVIVGPVRQVLVDLPGPVLAAAQFVLDAPLRRDLAAGEFLPEVLPGVGGRWRCAPGAPLAADAGAHRGCAPGALSRCTYEYGPVCALRVHTRCGVRVHLQVHLRDRHRCALRVHLGYVRRCAQQVRERRTEPQRHHRHARHEHYHRP
jgi:hypothetical protein